MKIKFLLISAAFASLVSIYAAEAKGTQSKTQQKSKEIFVSSAAYTVNSQRDYKTVLMLDFANKLYTNKPSISPETLTKKTAELGEQYNEVVRLSKGGKAPSTFSDAQVSFAKAVAKIFPVAGVLTGTAEISAKFLEHYRDVLLSDRNMLPGQLARQTLNQNQIKSQRSTEKVLAESWDNYVRKNKSSTSAWNGDNALQVTYDLLAAGPLNVRPSDSDKNILDQTPGYKAYLQSKAMYSLVGELNENTESSISSIAALKHELFEEMKAVNKNNMDQISALANGLDQQKLKAEEQEIAFNEMAAQRSEVYLASKLITIFGGPSGASVGAGVHAVGNAYLDVSSALFNYKNALFKDGSLSGTFKLSGDLLSIGLNLATSLFGLGGPNVDQMILDQIAGLRDQVAAVQKQLNDRFDQVDLTLNKILFNLEKGFTELGLAVHKSSVANQKGFNTVYQTLLANQEKLYQHEQNMHSYLSAGFNRATDAINVRCLQATLHFPGYKMDIDTFKSCVDEYLAYATHGAFDDLSTAPKSLDTSDDSILLNRLRNFPLQNNIDYLMRVASDRFDDLDMIPRQDLANPIEWSLAANSYVKMLRDWPEYRKYLSLAGVNQMIQIGEDIQTAVSSLSSEDIDGTITGRTAFFRKLIDNYREKTAQLYDLVHNEISDEYSQTHLNGVNPMKGLIIEQVQKRESYLIGSLVGNMSREPGAGPAGDTLPIPPLGGLYDRIPDSLKYAVLLGMGRLTMSYQIHGGVEQECYVRLPYDPSSDPHGWYELSVCSKLDIFINFQGSTSPSISHVVRLSNEYSHRTSRFLEQAIKNWSVNQDYWTGPFTAGILPNFFKSAYSLDPKSAAQALSENTAFNDNLTARMMQEKKLYFKRIENAVTGSSRNDDGSLSTVQANSLRVAFENVAVAKLLLQNYASLSLPDTVQGQDSFRGSLYGIDGLPEFRISHSRAYTSVNEYESILFQKDLEELEEKNRPSSIDGLEKTLMKEIIPQISTVERMNQVTDTLENLKYVRELIRNEASSDL